MVNVVDVATFRDWPIMLLPDIGMQADSMRLPVLVFLLTKPIALTILIESLSIVFNVSDGPSFLLNFHKAPPFDIVTITYRSANSQ